MLSDRGSKLWAMWAPAGWAKRGWGDLACFETGWNHFNFDGALRGEGCNRNWLDGVMGWPSFARPAPALLGFDETIYAFCSAQLNMEEGPFYGDNGALAQRCVQANENVLRVFANWNLCTNMHWQTCAFHGKLPGQDGRRLHFSIAPKNLDVGIFENPDSCVGGCDHGYAVSDVYFAEVCITSFVCTSTEERTRALCMLPRPANIPSSILCSSRRESP